MIKITAMIKQKIAMMGTLQKIIVKGNTTRKLAKILDINKQQSKSIVIYLQLTQAF